MILKRSQVADGDILMTITGNVGRVVWLRGLRRANINQHIARIRVNDRRVDPEFVYHYLSQPRIRGYYESIVTGQAYPQISLEQVRETLVPLLPLAEQRSIASALSDADGMIESLERLISKKQDFKQGIMQELLTGRTRLPGFTGKWSEVTAGDIGTFKGGSGFPLLFQGSETGKFPFFKVSDMNIDGNELFMNRANNYVSESQRKSIAALVMPPGAIVFAKVGAAVFLERKRILTVPSCIDNNMAAFMLDSSRADVRFIHFGLSSFRMSSLVATGALPSLNGKQLRSIPIALPDQLSEQRAIAGALADADVEIDALQRRTTKARDIKQGMMQELLSGRTRLPTQRIES